MLTLTLLRHAKSSWDDPGVGDFDRPLNARGLEAAPRAGRALHEFGAGPSLVLSSPSRRTRQTLELALPEMHLANPPGVEFAEDLYLAAPSVMLEHVRALGPDVKSALLIGHNPGMHNLAMALAGSGPDDLKTRLAEKFPTAAIAIFTFDTQSWRDVGPRMGRLTAFWTPKT